MKFKHLFIAGFIAVSGICALTTSNALAAFSPNDCPATSLYKQDKGKPYDEIKTVADCNLPAGSTKYDLVDKAADIINVIASVVGVIAVFVIVLGGIFYATSAGDATKAKRGQNAIMYGIIGLIVTLLAFVIVKFVLKSIF